MRVQTLGFRLFRLRDPQVSVVFSEPWSKSQNLNPKLKPYTQNLNPTLNPDPQNLNPKPQTLNDNHETTRTLLLGS